MHTIMFRINKKLSNQSKHVIYKTMASSLSVKEKIYIIFGYCKQEYNLAIDAKYITLYITEKKWKKICVILHRTGR